MTEKDKMLAGIPYSAVDPGLLEELGATHDIIHQYNATVPSDVNTRLVILKQLLGGIVDDSIIINQPFYCDYKRDDTSSVYSDFRRGIKNPRPGEGRGLHKVPPKQVERPATVTSIDETEHPDGDGVAGCELQIVFYEISDLCVFDLFPLLALSSYFEGDAVYLEIGYLGRGDFVNLRGPDQKVGLPHVSGINMPVFGKGQGDVAVAQIQFLHLGEKVVAVSGLVQRIEKARFGKVLDIVGYFVPA